MCLGYLRFWKSQCRHSKEIPESTIENAFVEAYNAIVQEEFSCTAGKIRNVLVLVGGCSYALPASLEERVRKEFGTVMAGLDVVETLIEVLPYVMKWQIFLDGNKQAAVIFAGHHLI